MPDFQPIKIGDLELDEEIYKRLSPLFQNFVLWYEEKSKNKDAGLKEAKSKENKKITLGN